MEKSDKSRIVKNTTYLTIAFIGQKILALIYFIIIARLLGAENVGDYTVALSFTMVFGIFIDLGTSPVITREIAKDESHISDYLSTLFSYKTVLAIFVYGIIIVAAKLLNYSPELTSLIYISGLVMITDTYSLSIYSALRGLQNLKTESYGILINQITAMTIGILSLFFIAKSPMVLIVAFLIGSATNVAFALYTAIKKYNVRFKIDFNKETAKNLYTLAIPFGLSGIFTRVYSYIDSIILQKFLGSASVGLYAVAYKIPFALQFIPTAFAASIYPAMSSFFGKDNKKLEKVWYISTLYLLILALPMFWGIYTLADLVILKFYGQEFLDSVIILKTLIIGLVFIFLNFPLGSLLAATNKQNVNTILIGVTMLVNIVSNMILIKMYGIQGAAFAFLISHGFLFFASLIYASRLITLHINKFALILPKLILATYIMGVCVQSLKSNGYWIISIPIGALVYFIILLLLKVINLKEIKEFAQFRK